MIKISGNTLTMSTERFHQLLSDGSNVWKLFRKGRFITVWNAETKQVYQGVYLGIDAGDITLTEV